MPLLLAVMLGAWLTYMTVAYLSGHLSGMLSFFGQLDVTVGANLTDRLNGSPDHMLVTRLRLLMTLFLWGLAFLGGLRRARHGRLDLNHALLALAPFPLIAMQNYGGELLMRIYLYALPFMAFFAAALFFPRPQERPSWRASLACFPGKPGNAGLVPCSYAMATSARIISPLRSWRRWSSPTIGQSLGRCWQLPPATCPPATGGMRSIAPCYLEKLVLEQDVPGMIEALECPGCPGSLPDPDPQPAGLPGNVLQPA